MEREKIKRILERLGIPDLKGKEYLIEIFALGEEIEKAERLSVLYKLAAEKINISASTLTSACETAIARAWRCPTPMLRNLFSVDISRRKPRLGDFIYRVYRECIREEGKLCLKTE